MTRPRKRTVLCRKLAAAAADRSRAHNDYEEDADPPDHAEEAVTLSSESDSDPEVLLFGDMGEDFDLVEHPPPFLAWKAGAGSHLRTTYTGNSRTTQWRREVSKKQRLASLNDNMKIYHFFRPEHESHRAFSGNQDCQENFTVA